MRILYNSKLPAYKEPFGTLNPGQTCTLHVHVPVSVGAKNVECILHREDGMPVQTIALLPEQELGDYKIFGGSFAIGETGLYYYHFRVCGPGQDFRLFKYGDDTNMEAGDEWQLSCVPQDWAVPEWAQGAIFYQIFPDRFARAGECDPTGKLEPYTIHESWDEDVHWQPDEFGNVLNNDFFGGNFRGITAKLDYLASLGVTILYLNPISKSFSNHRYDTGDYKTPDPMLGTPEDFAELCREAHRRGIRVLLDGVYSHTGSDSLYFNKQTHFDSTGAYNSQRSPYSSWYQFYSWPNQYRSWWNFETLPTVNKFAPEFIEYILTGEDSVVAHWLRLGADGFRLDVADELPSEFLALLKKRVREIKPDALVLGEVWEDASSKIAYGKRTRYFVDGTLDSVMNYPFRTAILDFLRDRDDGRGLKNTVMSIAENYPRQVLLANMNLLGSHDTPRILTALVDDFDGSRAEKSQRRLSDRQLDIALERLHCAVFLQYTLPGSPSIYYGDEAGMEGYSDPFNRRTYPWGRENGELIRFYRDLARLRQKSAALRYGDIEFFQAGDRKLGFVRQYAGRKLRIHVNCGYDVWQVPAGKAVYGRNLRNVTMDWVCMKPMGYCVVQED